jgi:GT2 family glycosyltransferase
MEVSVVGGAAMYRRSVLERVGSFNPYLYSDGEPELCVRIRHAGYRIIRLGHTIAYHYADPNAAISTLVGRWRRNLWLGMGQSMRYHLGTELFWPYVKERGYACFPALALGAGFASFVFSVVTRKWSWFGSWFSLVFILIVGETLAKRSIYRTGFSLVQRLFVLDGTVRGFLLKPMAPDTYPCKFEKVQ